MGVLQHYSTTMPKRQSGSWECRYRYFVVGIIYFFSRTCPNIVFECAGMAKCAFVVSGF